MKNLGVKPRFGLARVKMTGNYDGAVYGCSAEYSLQEIKSGRGNYNFPGVDFSRARAAVNKGVK